MYAIVKDGSRQFRVAEGDEVEFDRKPSAKAGDKVEFGEILLVHDGKKAVIGSPTVAGAKVTGEVLSEEKGPKLRVVKYKRRKGMRKATGHREKYTRVRITGIKTK